MERLTKFFWASSLILFLAAALYVYAMLPAQVKLVDDAGGGWRVEKSAFFYIALGVMLFSNLLIFAVRRRLKEYSRTDASIPRLVLWLEGFSGVLNIFYGLAVVSIMAINNNVGMPLAGLFYVGIFMTIVWIAALIPVIRRRR